MKNVFLALAVLLVTTVSNAQTSKAIRPSEGLKLFIGNINQLQVANENPYEQYSETVLGLYLKAILGWDLKGTDQAATTVMKCEIEKGVESCLLSINHVDDRSTDEAEESSMMFKFEIDRSQQKPRIKGNKVSVMMAG